jgi:hypothetical protein
MAKDNRSVLSQLQSVGEDAITRIAKSPAARSALEKGTQLKGRAGKTLSGLEGVEERLIAIEKRLAALEGKAKPATKPAASSSKSSSSRTGSSTTSKPPTTSRPSTTTSTPKSSS